MRRLAPALALAAVLVPGAAFGEAGQTPPGPLSEVGFEQRLGEPVPQDLLLRDQDGRAVTLGELLDGRPAILALVYYDCPMLCSLVLQGLTRSLKAVSFDPGDEFQVLVVSFDPRESPEQAAATREDTLARYDRPGAEEGWHFLVGEPEAVARLTEAVGFRYAFDEETGEFAHAAGVVVLTPSARVAKVFYGIEYAPRDLRLGLVEAADERIGTAVDQLLLYCFRYDPTVGRYTQATMNLIRLGGVLTLAVLGAFLTTSLLRERRLRRRQAEVH